MHLAECIPYFYLCLNYEDISVIKTAIESLHFLVDKFKFKHESIIALGKKLYQTQHTKSMIASVWLLLHLKHGRTYQIPYADFLEGSLYHCLQW